jgi:hypothetical protein
MRQAFDGALSPTPHYYEVKGRAAEIARDLGSAVGGAEHLFLGMLHDAGWPVIVLSGLVDLGQAETAVLEILKGPDYSPPPPAGSLVSAGYMELWGADVAFGMGDSYIGLEHALLSMLRKRDTIPARTSGSGRPPLPRSRHPRGQERLRERPTRDRRLPAGRAETGRAPAPGDRRSPARWDDLRLQQPR